MCLPLPILGVAISIAGAFAQAAVTSAIAGQQAKIEQEQLKVDIENERIKAIGETVDRMNQFRRDEAENRAALSTTGVENLSYLQGIAPSNQRIVRRDIARLDFNTGQVVGRKKYEIAVAGWRSRTTKLSAFTEAGAQSAATIGGAMVRGT